MDLIVGSNSGLGRAFAEKLAQLGHQLILAGHDVFELDRLKKDLELRFSIHCHSLYLDLKKVESSASFNELSKYANQIEACYLIAGMYSDKKSGQTSTEEALDLLKVNFVSIIGLVEYLLKFPRPLKLLVASSVGAGRPRGQGGLYCAAKRGLEFYAESLAQAWDPERLQVKIIRYGYLDTSMSFGRKNLFPALTPERAALKSLETMQNTLILQYIPSWWWLIIFILRMIPTSLFKLLRS